MLTRALDRPAVCFLGFALVFFVFHQAPSTFLDYDGEAAVDVLTPFLVIGASTAVLLSLGAPRAAIGVALVAGTLYVHGHGAHLAANSIHNHGAEGDVVYFWDEHYSHIEAVLGWFGLIAAFCLAESAGVRTVASRTLVAVTAAILGWTFFTSTVEGQTWWLELAATAVWIVWIARSADRGPILRAATGAFVLAAALIGLWAILQGGVVEFSDL